MIDSEQGFSGDEAILLAVCAFVSLLGIWRWLTRLRPISKLGASPWLRVPMYAAVALGFAALWHVIWNWADADIPAFSGYVWLVLAMGGTWLVGAVAVFPWLGIGLRDDALEQRNPAAVWALSGAMLAVLLTFAGSNIGEGPSFWNNVFTGLLSTGALLACWLVLAVGAGMAHSVSQERDIAVGLRLAAYLVAIGLVFARAAAGDWHSMARTTLDLLRDGWFAGAILLGAVALERTLRPSEERGDPIARSSPSLATLALVPAVLALAVSVLWIVQLGPWEGAER